MNDDKLRHLTGEVRVPVSRSIDDLHAAAILESTGLTDDQARRLYGVSDAFALAAVVRARVEPVATPIGEHPETSPLERRLHRTSLGHGILYAAMALAVAGLLGVVSSDSLVPTIVAGGAIGWVWAAVTSWLSFQLAGRGAPSRARRLLWVSACSALFATALLAGVLWGLSWLPWTAALVAFSLVCIQVGGTLLFLSGHRRWLLFTSLPGAAAGIVSLGANTVSRTDDEAVSFLVVTLVMGCVLGLVGLGFAGVFVSQVADEQPFGGSLRRLPGFGAVVVNALLCAAFLLVPQAQLLRRGGDEVLAMAGLMLVMGLVEWRAIALAGHARGLLRTASMPRSFRRRLRLVLTRDVLVVMVAAAATNLAVGAGLHWWGHLNHEGTSLLVATVPLAGAYLLVLAAANADAYRWLNLALVIAVAAELLLLTRFAATPSTALTVGCALLFCCAAAVILTRPVRNFA